MRSVLVPVLFFAVCALGVRADFCQADCSDHTSGTATVKLPVGVRLRHRLSLALYQRCCHTVAHGCTRLEQVELTALFGACHEPSLLAELCRALAVPRPHCKQEASLLRLHSVVTARLHSVVAARLHSVVAARLLTALAATMVPCRCYRHQVGAHAGAARAPVVT